MRKRNIDDISSDNKPENKPENNIEKIGKEECVNTPDDDPMIGLTTNTETYQTITLHLYDEIIILEPIKVYYLKDDNIYKEDKQGNKSNLYEIKKVVVYKFKYLYDGGKIKESTIPYYVSDGYTNDLRVNMLYPFMSFNILNNNDSPYTSHEALYKKNGLLFKYQIGTNIQINKINDRINYNFKNYYYSKNLSRDSIHKLLDDIYSDSNGLRSIFNRLENLLDYIIGISSCDIHENDNDDDEKIKSYRPLTNNMDNDSRIINNDDKIKYNMKIINDTKIIDHYDIYRKYIVNEIRESNNWFKKSKLFKFELTKVTIENCTRSEFNSTMHICSNYNYNINVNKYVDISLKFHLNIKTYIKQLSNISNLDDTMQNEYNLLHNFYSLLYDITIINYDVLYNALKETREHWKTICLSPQLLPSPPQLPQQSSLTTAYYVEYPLDDSRINLGVYSDNINNAIINYDIRVVNGHIATDEIFRTLYNEYKEYCKQINNIIDKFKNKIITANKIIIDNTDYGDNKTKYLKYFNKYLPYKKEFLEKINIAKEKLKYAKLYVKKSEDNILHNVELFIPAIQRQLDEMNTHPETYQNILLNYKIANNFYKK